MTVTPVTAADVLPVLTGLTTNARRADAFAAWSNKRDAVIIPQIEANTIRANNANVIPVLADIAAAIRERPVVVTPPTPAPVEAVWLDFSGVFLTPSDWNALFNPSTWAEPKLAGGIPWAAKDAFIRDKDMVVRVTDTGCGQVQAGDPYYSSKGLWEIDVTFGPCVDGLIQSPLWLYNHNTGDEADFEVVGKTGLHISPHTWAQFDMGGGVPLAGDLTGQRHKLGLEYRAGESLTWYVDGLIVGKKTAADYAPGVFPKSPMKYYGDAWPTTNIDWAGEWKGVRGQTLETVIHSRRFTAL